MQYNQGDIVLLPFPFTNQQGSKVRPEIVVSNLLVNLTSKDVIIAQQTTQNIKDRRLAVEINNSHVFIILNRDIIRNTFIVKSTCCRK